jgi:hypothetical protein
MQLHTLTLVTLHNSHIFEKATACVRFVVCCHEYSSVGSFDSAPMPLLAAWALADSRGATRLPPANEHSYRGSKPQPCSVGRPLITLVRRLMVQTA